MLHKSPLSGFIKLWNANGLRHTSSASNSRRSAVLNANGLRHTSSASNSRRSAVLNAFTEVRSSLLARWRRAVAHEIFSAREEVGWRDTRGCLVTREP